MNDRITDTIFLVFFFAGPVKRSSRMVREVYPEIEPEKEGNLAEGMIFRGRVMCCTKVTKLSITKVLVVLDDINRYMHIIPTAFC